MSDILPQSVNINIPKLFEDVYGIYARFPIYLLGDKKPGQEKKVTMEDWNFPDQLPQQGTRPYSSRSGVYMWDRFAFKDVFPKTLRVKDDLFYLPEATVVEVQQAKNIVKTPLIGRNGTVKELMSDGDHILTFRGFIINFDNTNEYPEEEAEMMNKLFSIKSELTIVSKLLNTIHGISDIVFESKNYPPLEGYANVQPYEFTALSDINIVLDNAN